MAWCDGDSSVGILAPCCRWRRWRLVVVGGVSSSFLLSPSHRCRCYFRRHRLAVVGGVVVVVSDSVVVVAVLSLLESLASRRLVVVVVVEALFNDLGGQTCACEKLGI